MALLSAQGKSMIREIKLLCLWRIKTICLNGIKWPWCLQWSGWRWEQATPCQKEMQWSGKALVHLGLTLWQLNFNMFSARKVEIYKEKESQRTKGGEEKQLWRWVLNPLNHNGNSYNESSGFPFSDTNICNYSFHLVLALGCQLLIKNITLLGQVELNSLVQF